MRVISQLGAAIPAVFLGCCTVCFFLSRMSKLSAFQQKLRAKLEGGHFRHINERLYTQSGHDSFDMMKKEPALFDSYHAGYRAQVEDWPENPLDVIIREIRKSPKTAVVGDFGCGEARLSSEVSQTVHSFDLVAANDRVTACDIARVPLKASTLDFAVYCLSLMGTNFLDFLREAHRVLKPGGRLLIAEVRSRFETGEFSDKGGAVSGHKRKRDDSTGPPTASSPGVQQFVSAVRKLGFAVDMVDEKNKMFVLLYFTKKEGKDAAPPSSSAVASAKEPGTVVAGKESFKPKPSAASGSGERHLSHKAGNEAKKQRHSGSSPAPGARHGSGGDSSSSKPSSLLKACIYKRR